MLLDTKDQGVGGLPKGVQFLVSFSLFSVSQHLCLNIVLLLLSKGDSFESAEI